MNAEPILHIAPAGQWEEAQLDGVYRGDTLGTEGFIHCSGPDQVLRVAQARFRGRTERVGQRARRGFQLIETCSHRR